MRLMRTGPLIVGAMTLAALSGCAHDDPVARAEVAIFGAPAGAGGYPGTYVAEERSWGEPAVVPAGFEGPRAVAETDGPYLLNSGDKLRVYIYGQPNLSRGYTVDHDGKIAIPLIGTVEARGRATGEPRER